MVVLNYLNEIWKDISGFGGLYQASNFGRVRSLDKLVRHSSGGLCVKKGKILKLYKQKGGYLVVGLIKDGKQKQYKVHRLVWMAFHGEIPEDMQINHKDEDKTNNRLDNLELVTRKENLNYGTRNERSRKARINHLKLSKPVFQYDKQGNLIKEWCSTREIERELGFNSGNIRECCNGNRNSANGYKWSYKNI